MEPLVTKSKEDTTHSRRVVFSYLKQKDAVTELFRTVAPKIAEASGRLHPYPEDLVSVWETVPTCASSSWFDFNDAYTFGKVTTAEESKPKTRRSRKSAAKKTDAVEDATIVEEKKSAARAKAPKAAPVKNAAAPAVKKTNVGKKM